jgi:hypothetical protein
MRRIAGEVAGKATLFSVTVLETGHGVVAYAWRCSAARSSASSSTSSTWRDTTASPSIAGRPPATSSSAAPARPRHMQFYLWSDALTLRFLTRDAVVGWYGAANQLYSTMNFVPLVIITALLPALTRFHAQDRETMRVAVEKGMLAVLTTGIPLAAGSLVLSGELIGFLRYPPGSVIPCSPCDAGTDFVDYRLAHARRHSRHSRRRAEGGDYCRTTPVIARHNVPFIIFFDRVYGNGAPALRRQVPAKLLMWPSASGSSLKE